jgi:hypothetical protein
MDRALDSHMTHASDRRADRPQSRSKAARIASLSASS